MGHLARLALSCIAVGHRVLLHVVSASPTYALIAPYATHVPSHGCLAQASTSQPWAQLSTYSAEKEGDLGRSDTSHLQLESLSPWPASEQN